MCGFLGSLSEGSSIGLSRLLFWSRVLSPCFLRGDFKLCFLWACCLTFLPLLLSDGNCCLRTGALSLLITAVSHDGGLCNGMFLWKMFLAVMLDSIWVIGWWWCIFWAQLKRRLWAEASLEHVSLSGPDFVCSNRFWALPLSTDRPCSVSGQWTVSTHSAHSLSQETGRSSLAPR